MNTKQKIQTSHVITCKCGQQYSINTLQNMSNVNICLFCHSVYTKEYKIDIESNKNLSKMEKIRSRIVEKNKDKK